MSRITATRSRRGAFTLVELMVVMVIIAILAGLFLAAVQQVRRRAKEMQARNDVQQLAMGVESFKSRYEVSYLPSRVILLNNLNNYNVAPYNNPNTFVGAVAQDTKAFLLRMWPRLGSYGAGNPLNGLIFNPNPPPNGLGSMGWMPSDPNANANSAYYLEGDQCIVFFLGGIQLFDANVGVWGCKGFGTNRANPTQIPNPQVANSGNFPTEAPLFDFPSGRLALAAPGVNGRDPNVGLSFFDSYAAMPPSQGNDPKCRPYLYFTSYNGNDYSGPGVKYGTNGDCSAIQQVPQGNEVYPTLANPAPVLPYQESTTKYMNSNGFQIICAGRDRAFGPGGTNWFPNNGYGPTQPGSDDLSNFSKLLLSEPTQ